MKDVTSSLQLYRDCLRLVGYVAKQSGGDKRVLTAQVRDAFRKNAGARLRHEKEPLPARRAK